MRSNNKTPSAKKKIETDEIIQRFNDAFQHHDPSLLNDLVAENCVMESIQGPNGIRYEGYDSCISFWQSLASDPDTRFDIEEILVFGDRAVIRWHYFWGNGENDSVRGINLMKVYNGKIIEALGYAKTVPTTGLEK